MCRRWRRGGKEPRALTVEECREWLSLLDEHRHAVRKGLPDLTRFMLGTGCRLGEVLGVHWADVDLDHGLLDVHRTVIRAKGKGLIARTSESRSGVRVLRLPVWLVEMLRNRRDGAADDAPIFPDEAGGYRDRNNVLKDFRKVRVGTPFEWVVPHTYRKTVATLLDAGGLSARTIADQ